MVGANTGSTPVTEESSVRGKLLVTGCGRSGTRYVTFVLRRLGLDVRHERMGRDGIASWLLAVAPRSVVWGDAATGTTFENVFHQVRHPLDAIPSCTTLKPISWRFISEHVDCGADAPPLLRAARYWLYWNERAERIADWRYRIEDFPEIFDDLCARLGVDADRTVLARVANDVNTRRAGRPLHLYDELCERVGVDPSRRLRSLLARSRSPSLRPLTWHELTAMDAPLAERIRAKARAYGYAA